MGNPTEGRRKAWESESKRETTMVDDFKEKRGGEGRGGEGGVSLSLLSLLFLTQITHQPSWPSRAINNTLLSTEADPERRGSVATQRYCIYQRQAPYRINTVSK